MIQQTTPTTLTVYKASAGSGKTFRLTVEYIKLLLNDPNSYKHILAVTFTNKATDEMKTRILSTLYGLHNQLFSSQSYLDKLLEETTLSEEVIRERSGIALHNLLHDYQYFQVETIDKFFQHIFRNLSRELMLTSNLRVEIRDTEVLQMAVDNLIDSLKTSDKEFQWLWKYIRQQMSENKSWNIINQVKEFGKHMFKDYYKANKDKLKECLEQPEFFKQYTDSMRAMRENSMKGRETLALTSLKEIEEYGFSIENFASKSRGIYGYFVKASEGKTDLTEKQSLLVNDCLASADPWYKQSKNPTNDEKLKNFIESRLMQALQRLEDYRKTFLTADATLKNLFYLQLLGSIEKMVYKINEDNNCFMLSDTQNLLQQLIGDDDTPFVFEKTGTRLKHIMIDEFQDTSKVQWSNFKILLRDCMDRGYSNLIVGDVKQSIYRWRDGDWSMLAGIKEQFSHTQDTITVTSLDTNFRSRKKIVTFNNVFFSTASDITSKKMGYLPHAAEQIKNAYYDTWQKTDDNKGDNGYIQVNVRAKDTTEDDILTWLEEEIARLLQNGVPANKIGILDRKNDNLSLIARYFQVKQPKWKMISDEAFKLDFSIAVNTLIMVMTLIEHPDDELTLKTLVKNYQTDILNKDISEEDLFMHEQDLWLLLPEKFQDERFRHNLRSLPLMELIEQLCTLFHITDIEGQDAYLCKFLDVVADYTQNEICTIEDFLDAWELELHKKTIQSDVVDGIRLLTIHKSKGLAVANLFIPFCEWKMDHPSTLWCEPGEAPYDALPLVPVNSQKNLVDTIYKDEYENEELQNTVDNLNLLYVAFTRAIDRLYVSAKKASTNYRGELVEEVLREMVKDPEMEGCQLTEKDHEAFTFEYGEPFFTDSPKKKEKEKEKKENIFTLVPTSKKVVLDMFEQKAVFKQSGMSDRFIDSDEEAEAEQEEYIKTGTLLHHVLSQIVTTDDVEPVLKEMVAEGVLTGNDKMVQLNKLLQERLSDPKAREWFSPRWKVHNECSIITGGSKEGHKELRPDRVISDGSHIIVIDFKFGTPKEIHRDQVLRYMDLLRDMGYQQVEGYLWYVYQNKKIKI